MEGAQEHTVGRLPTILILAVLLACSGDAVFSSGTTVELSLEGVDRLEAGQYRAWVVGGAGDTALLGTFRGGPDAGLEAELTVDDPSEVFVDVRPPGGGDRPSPYLRWAVPWRGARPSCPSTDT